MILKNIEKLVVDANPIISAIIGGNARSVFFNAESTKFYTTKFNFSEVEKYIPILSLKRNLPAEDLYMALSLLPIHVYDEDSYRSKLNQAKKLIGQRDADDIHLLALSLKHGCPVWSNDRDFEGIGVIIYSTLQLLRE